MQRLAQLTSNDSTIAAAAAAVFICSEGRAGCLARMLRVKQGKIGDRIKSLPNCYNN
jgi:hypothetical protein